MKKYHNNRLFSLFSKFKNAFKKSASTLIPKLSKTKKFECTHNKPVTLPYSIPSISDNKNRNNMKMGIQIETIEIIEGEQDSSDIVIIKLSNPQMRLDSQDNCDIDSFDKQLNNVLMPFPSSTRIH